MGNNPRTLVICSHPMNQVGNTSKTLESLFSLWEKENIAEIYFRFENTDSEVCDNFYRITDVDCIQRLKGSPVCGTAHKTGYHVSVSEDALNHHRNPVFRKLFSFMKKSTFFSLGREVMWKLTDYKTKEFQRFLDDFNPEVVFLVSSSIVWHYDIAMDICKERNIPLVLFYTDDYLEPRLSPSPFYWLKWSLIRNKFRQSLNYTNHIVTIGGEMAKEYSEKFGVNCYPFMNSVEIEKQTKKQTKKEELTFLYAGSLHTNRWKQLVEIGRIADQLNKSKDLKKKIKISIYSRPNEHIDKKFGDVDSVELCGFVDSKKIKELISEADVLIHTEAFDKKSRNVTRLSVSTKIPEYMSAGKCILAYGPSDVASIKYIDTNNVGVVASTKETLEEIIEHIVTSDDIRDILGKQARLVAEKNHNKETNSLNFQKLLSNIQNESIAQ